MSTVRQPRVLSCWFIASACLVRLATSFKGSHLIGPGIALAGKALGRGLLGRRALLGDEVVVGLLLRRLEVLDLGFQLAAQLPAGPATPPLGASNKAAKNASSWSNGRIIEQA